MANAYLDAVKAAQPKSLTAVNRLPSATAEDLAVAADLSERIEITRPTPERRKPAGKDDGLAYVTLDVRQWGALINPIGPCSAPQLRSIRDAVATACRGKRGPVTLWHPATGFAALLSEVLRSGKHRPEQNAAAALVTAQVYRTMR